MFGSAYACRASNFFFRNWLDRYDFYRARRERSASQIGPKDLPTCFKNLRLQQRTNDNDPTATLMSDKTRRSTTMMRDWRKSLGGSSVSGGGSAGVYHRIGHPVATLRFLYQYALIAACCCMLFVVFLYMKPAAYETSSSSAQSATSPVSSGAIVADPSTLIYNSTYPLTRPVRSGPSSTGFRIALIADLDQQSRVAGAKADTWRSYMKYGNLLWSAATRSLTVQWDTAEPAELRHQFALKGRGMELSELVTFNGRLLTVDDRTGLVYEVRQTNGRADGVVPWVVLMDGDGRGSTQKGFKSEWATVKDEQLWVGSMGKEWTTALGQFESFDPMWVKVVTAGGQVSRRQEFQSSKLFSERFSHLHSRRCTTSTGWKTTSASARRSASSGRAI